MIASDAKAISSATEKIMSAVEESWRTSPFTSARMPSACGSGTSAAGTSSGPTGQNVSNDFARVNCRSARCRSRALTSFAQR